MELKSYIFVAYLFIQLHLSIFFKDNGTNKISYIAVCQYNTTLARELECLFRNKKTFWCTKMKFISNNI